MRIQLVYHYSEHVEESFQEFSRHGHDTAKNLCRHSSKMMVLIWCFVDILIYWAGILLMLSLIYLFWCLQCQSFSSRPTLPRGIWLSDSNSQLESDKLGQQIQSWLQQSGSFWFRWFFLLLQLAFVHPSIRLSPQNSVNKKCRIFVQLLHKNFRKVTNQTWKNCKRLEKLLQKKCYGFNSLKWLTAQHLLIKEYFLSVPFPKFYAKMPK